MVEPQQSIPPNLTIPRVERSHTLVRVSGPTAIATRRPSEGSYEWWAQVRPLSIRLHSPHTNNRYAYRSLRKLFTRIHRARLLILGTSKLEAPFGSPKVPQRPIQLCRPMSTYSTLTRLVPSVRLYLAIILAIDGRSALQRPPR